MADDQELTSSTTPSAPPPGQAQPDGVAPQPASEQTQKPVNLFELPDFRAYQAQITRNQQQERAAYEQRIQQLEQRMVQAEESGLDDFEKTQRRNQRLEQQIAYIQQAEQQRQYQADEQRRVLEDMQLVARKTGVPIDQLYKAQTLEQAWDIGLTYQEQRRTTTAQAEEQKKAAHQPDMGQGKAPGPSSRTDQKLREAKTSVDLAKIMLGRED